MLFLLAQIACDGSPSDDPVPVDTGEDCDTVAYTDADGDGWGDLDTVTIVCELSDDQVTLGGDCDDDNPEATPDQAWYLDADGDGAGDAQVQIASCEAQDGLVENAGDCDDLDASSHPEGVEVCDGADNDCDGAVDEDASDSRTWYADKDDDGHGSATDTTQSCAQPSGYLADSSDCDDADPWISPDADEVCDSVDNDCDGSVDFDGWIPTDYATVAEALEAVPGGAHLCIDEGRHDVDDLSYEGWLTLEGQGSEVTTLDAQGQGFLQIEGDFKLTGAHLTNITSQSDSWSPGIHQERGDITLRDVEVSDLLSDEHGDYTATTYALLIYCDGVASVTLEDVEIHHVLWDHDGYSYQQSGSLIDCWGGDFTAEDVSIHDTEGAGYYTSNAISYWGLEVNVSGLSYSDNSSTVEGDYGYYNGPFSIDGVLEGTLEHVSVTDNRVTMDTKDMVSASLYAPWLGSFGSETSAELRFFESTGNSITTTGGDSLRVYGLAMRSYYDRTTLRNAIIADNSLDEAYQHYGLFYGAALSLENVDIVDNELGDAYAYYGMFYIHGSEGLSVVNTNIVGNEAEAEIADYGRYVYLPTGESAFVWDSNNLYDNELDGEVDLMRYGEIELEATNGLAVDPLYTDRSGGEYTLATGSPVIDAGNADITDADGSASDLGAYGGAYSDGW